MKIKNLCLIGLICSGIFLVLLGLNGQQIAILLSKDKILSTQTKNLLEKIDTLSIQIGIGLLISGILALLTICKFNWIQTEKFPIAGLNNSLGSHKEKVFNLFLISFLVLFFELLVIRWLSTEINLLGYFKNIVLISCFLGLGIGCALANTRTNFFSFFPLILAYLFFATVTLMKVKTINLYPWSGEEFMFGILATIQIFDILAFYL